MVKKIIKLVFVIMLLFMVVVFFMYWLERLKVLPTTIVMKTVSKVFNNAQLLVDDSQAATGNFQDNDALLLEKLRLQKQQEALVKRQAEMGIKEEQILAREQNVELKEQKIKELEKKITEKEKSLNQISKKFENKNEVLRYNVQSLINMPPDNAVDILNGYDDQILIDTLLVADEIADEENTQSLVPYWLSLMDAQRASQIQEKLLYRN